MFGGWRLRIPFVFPRRGYYRLHSDAGERSSDSHKPQLSRCDRLCCPLKIWWKVKIPTLFRKERERRVGPPLGLVGFQIVLMFKGYRFQETYRQFAKGQR